MHKCSYLVRAVVLSGVALMAGCSTLPEGNPQAEGGVNAPIDHLFPLDIKTVVTQLVDDLLNSHAVAHNHPLVAFREINDKTSNRLDTKAFSNQIRDQLTSSGKVRLVADTGPEHLEIKTSVKVVPFRENGHPPSSRFWKPKASSYRLLGVMADAPVRKHDGDARGPYYRVTLSLLDMEGGELLWIEEKDNIGHAATQQ